MRSAGLEPATTKGFGDRVPGAIDGEWHATGTLRAGVLEC